jgi:hypothetical protein
VNALANPKVGEYINKYFVSSFQKVATFQIVNGQKQGGNVAAYFCATDGRVLHAVAGPVNADTMLREAKWVVDNVKTAIEENKKSGEPFKVIFRKLHAERLRKEFGLKVEAATFDPPEAKDDGPLTYRDPNGVELLPVLPPPPIDGPDVSLEKTESKLKERGECEPVAGCKPCVDRGGRRWNLGNQGSVHHLMSAYSMVKIERLYATVFENILGEKVSTKPVVTINARGGGEPEDICIPCGLKARD